VWRSRSSYSDRSTKPPAISGSSKAGLPAHNRTYSDSSAFREEPLRPPCLYLVIVAAYSRWRIEFGGGKAELRWRLSTQASWGIIVGPCSRGLTFGVWAPHPDCRLRPSMPKTSY